MFPLPNAKLGVRFAVPKLNAGDAPPVVSGAGAEGPWSAENMPLPPPPPCNAQQCMALVK